MKKSLLFPALGAAALTGLTGELYRHIFCREGSPLLSPLMNGKSHKPDYYAHRDGDAARLRQLPQQRFTIRSSRGARLAGFYFPGGGEGKRIAFLIHGYRSEHAETAGMYWDYYRSRGFDLFCCDHEAHGESEGRFIGFGATESEDCLRWVDFLIAHFGEDLQIVLHGFSMGAATVMLMAPRCPRQVKCLVEDSGFQDATLQLLGQIGPLVYPLRLLHRLIAGVDLGRADVRPALAQSALPLLVIHGRKDPMVPFRNAPAIYERCRGPREKLYVDGARHVESMHVAPEDYMQTLDCFFASAHLLSPLP